MFSELFLYLLRTPRQQRLDSAYTENGLYSIYFNWNTHRLKVTYNVQWV